MRVVGMRHGVPAGKQEEPASEKNLPNPGAINLLNPIPPHRPALSRWQGFQQQRAEAAA